jgi:predicted nucleotidyltransferase
MYLEKILGTGTKVSVLNLLVNNPEKSYIEKDLAIEAGAAVSEINRQMPELVESGLVHLERVGKTKIYSINKEHFLVPSLEQLFRDLNKVYLDAARKIAKFAASHAKNLEAVILIGSVARGKVKSDIIKTPSDIDLVFVLKNGGEKEGLFNALIAYINKEIGSVYGIVCYPIILTRSEYIRALEKKDAFIIKVQSEGVELYGRKPRRFG